MGGRIYSLDQTHSECEWNLVKIMIQVVLLSAKSCEDKKKKKNGLYRNLAQSCKSARAFRVGFGPTIDENFGLTSGLRRTFCFRCTKVQSK